jgi:hemerythrin-like domain-containing protein
MLKTTERLSLEHRWIGKMTNGLGTVLADAKSENRLPGEACELLSLYETFADGRHQDKEEQVLFVELLDAASDRDRAVLGRLITDHEVERAHMSGMRVNLLGAVHGDPGCVREFVREASAYVALHRAHMLREEEILLPMIERLLDTTADERVALGFESIEGGPGDPHGVEEQVRQLLHRIGLPTPPAA